MEEYVLRGTKKHSSFSSAASCCSKLHILYIQPCLYPDKVYKVEPKDITHWNTCATLVHQNAAEQLLVQLKALSFYRLKRIPLDWPARVPALTSSSKRRLWSKLLGWDANQSLLVLRRHHHQLAACKQNTPCLLCSASTTLLHTQAGMWSILENALWRKVKTLLACWFVRQTLHFFVRWRSHREKARLHTLLSLSRRILEIPS